MALLFDPSGSLSSAVMVPSPDAADRRQKYEEELGGMVLDSRSTLPPLTFCRRLSVRSPLMRTPILKAAFINKVIDVVVTCVTDEAGLAQSRACG